MNTRNTDRLCYGTKLPLASTGTKVSARSTGEAYSKPGAPTRSTMDSQKKAATAMGKNILNAGYHARQVMGKAKNV